MADRGNIIPMDDLLKKIPEMRKVDLSLCISCKSVKLKCGLPRCPLLKLYDFPKLEIVPPVLDASNSLFGPSSQIFVGESGYPSVTAGALTSISADHELASLAGNPSLWTNLGLDQIMQLRFGLLRGMKKAHVLSPTFKNNHSNSKLLEGIQEISLAIKPVETESKFTGRISNQITLDSIFSPIGPSGAISKLDVTGHARIPQKVERVIDDELKSHEQISMIAENGYNVYYLQNIFSSGITGLDKNKRIVPTRWSITAVDDIVGNRLIQKLRDFKIIEDITVLHGGFYGNYFTFILFPQRWSFENFENWMKGSIYTLGSKGFMISQDNEDLKFAADYRAKSKYSNQAGGYYAARVSLLYYLHKIRRQAKVISIREITPEYLVPSGVWVVRESARTALESKPVSFSSREEMENYVETLLLTPLIEYKKRSKLLVQSSLDEFFS